MWNELWCGQNVFITSLVKVESIKLIQYITQLISSMSRYYGNVAYIYRIAGNFRWCKFSHKLKVQLRIKFRNLNFRNRTPLTHVCAQQYTITRFKPHPHALKFFYFRTYGTLSNYVKICTIRKFPTIIWYMIRTRNVVSFHNRYIYKSIQSFQYNIITSGVQGNTKPSLVNQTAPIHSA